MLLLSLVEKNFPVVKAERANGRPIMKFHSWPAIPILFFERMRLDTAEPALATASGKGFPESKA
jgi:hypothetical protein